jgi:hypothetical protein
MQNIHTNTSPQEYIPFQYLIKAKAYKILNYGRVYDKYTRYRISDNLEQITDIYVDDEPYAMPATTRDEFEILHHVEIHYIIESNKTMKSCILTNAEIDALVAKYGCKL